MLFIRYEETLEQKMRREYNLPHTVLPYDKDPKAFMKAVGEKMAERVINNIKLNGGKGNE